jgi:hypothetical protein
MTGCFSHIWLPWTGTHLCAPSTYLVVHAHAIASRMIRSLALFVLHAHASNNHTSQFGNQCFVYEEVDRDIET